MNTVITTKTRLSDAPTGSIFARAHTMNRTGSGLMGIGDAADDAEAALMAAEDAALVRADSPTGYVYRAAPILTIAGLAGVVATGILHKKVGGFGMVPFALLAVAGAAAGFMLTPTVKKNGTAAVQDSLAYRVFGTMSGEKLAGLGRLGHTPCFGGCGR